MATSTIMTNNRAPETLGTDVILDRTGNVRILRMRSAKYSVITGITLPEEDRPKTNVEFAGIKHYNGMNATLAIGTVNTNGKINCTHFANYNTAAYSTALVATDNFIGEAIWSV